MYDCLFLASFEVVLTHTMKWVDIIEKPTDVEVYDISRHDEFIKGNCLPIYIIWIHYSDGHAYMGILL